MPLASRTRTLLSQLSASLISRHHSRSHHSGSIIFIRLCDALCLRSCALALKKQSVAEWTQAEDTPTAGGLVLQELLVVAEVISIQN